MTSPESDPVKQLHALTKKAGEALDDDAVFDATINEINEKLRTAELEHLDKLIGISQQYDSQVALLRSNGVVRRLSDGSEGIFGEDGEEYPIPSLPSIIQRFCENPEKYEPLRRKVEQGFTKLILVPFASSIDALVNAYTEQLKEHNEDGKLFREGGAPMAAGSRGVVAELNTHEPVWLSQRYNFSNLVYFPKSFDQQNHGGLTKKEAIAQKGAWQVYLIEEGPIPRQGKGKNKNGRDQLETGLSARQYSVKLQADPQYKGEVGLTPESWLMRAMTRLKERGEVIDDFHGNGSLNSLLGAYFPEHWDVAFAHWNHDNSQAALGTYDTDNSDADGSSGTSSAVMV